MYRIDADGHVNNRFYSGNPVTGQPSTRVDADWLNALQDEIIGILTASGIEPSKANSAQLVEAIALKATANKFTRQQEIEALVGTDALRVAGAGTGVNGTGSFAGVIGWAREDSGGDGVRGGGDGGGAGVTGYGSQMHPTAAGPGVKAIAGHTAGGTYVRGALNLAPQPAPTTPSNGDIWVESGTNTLKVRINGITRTVTLT